MHWKDSLPGWYVKKYGHQPCVNIGTAGHVDHGKTTLIQALTGHKPVRTAAKTQLTSAAKGLFT